MDRKKLAFITMFSMVVTLIAVPVRGGVCYYDSGTLGSSWSGLWGGAVRFTNPESYTITVTKLTIRGHSSIAGSLDVYLWESDNGAPGSELASLTNQSLGSTWTSYDFSGSTITVGAGGDIFGGFRCGTADMPYDSDATTTNRSWYKFSSSSSWTQGEFGSGSDYDLMVRMEYIPEPTMLLLLPLGGLMVLRSRRKRAE